MLVFRLYTSVEAINRYLFGLFVFVSGLTSVTTPMYIAECSPTHMRGRLVSTHVVMIAAGQLVANVVSGIFSLVGKEGWR